MKKNRNSLIPENIEGKPVDISKAVHRSTMEDAISIYNAAKSVLIRPFLWKNIAGFNGTNFELVKGAGNNENEVMQKGDFLKIDIPGPGPGSGNGFDWVTVEAIEENFDPAADDSFGVRVRPCPEPGHKSSKVAAHFFKDKATSTFIIKRSQKKVAAYYHGRNEMPNLSGHGLFEKLRNAFVSVGALAGLSEIQWNLLINGLLEDEVKIITKQVEL